MLIIHKCDREYIYKNTNINRRKVSTPKYIRELKKKNRNSEVYLRKEEQCSCRSENGCVLLRVAISFPLAFKCDKDGLEKSLHE